MVEGELDATIANAQIVLLHALWDSGEQAQQTRALELSEAIRQTLDEADDIPPKKLAQARADLDEWERGSGSL